MSDGRHPETDVVEIRWSDGRRRHNGVEEEEGEDDVDVDSRRLPLFQLRPRDEI